MVSESLDTTIDYMNLVMNLSIYPLSGLCPVTGVTTDAVTRV